MSRHRGRIFVSEGTVEKLVRSILTKLDLSESGTDHRRVLAVLRYLDTRERTPVTWLVAATPAPHVTVGC